MEAQGALKTKQSVSSIAKTREKTKLKTGKFDYMLLTIIITLVVFGMIMLFSASFYAGNIKYNDGFYYISLQLRGVIVGGAAMIFFMNFDYRRFFKWSVAIYIVCIIALILVYIPGIGRGADTGDGINGAQRWFMIGSTSVQPSEFAKFGLIIVIAATVEKFGLLKMQSFKNGVLPILILMGGMDLIILLQPNFSVFSIIAMTCVVMLMFSGVKWSHLVILLCLALVAGGVLMMKEEYRVKRVLTFLDPWDPALEAGDGYQIQQSLFAIGSGGFFGRGIGQSVQKLLFLPFGESDFIFSIIAEEVGLFGSILLMIAYFLIVWRGYRIAWHAEDLFGKLLAGGISTLIGLQVFVNIAVATSSMPTTGVPLPFISYGSTAMICFLAASGILLNVSKKTAAIK